MSNLLDTLLTRREALKVGASSSAPIGSSCCGADERATPSRRSVRAVGAFRHLRHARRRAVPCRFVGPQGRKWTPQNFDIREIAPGVKWPMALFPQLAKQRERYSDSFDGGLGQRALPRAHYVQSGHMMNPALQKELPPIGTVVA